MCLNHEEKQEVMMLGPHTRRFLDDVLRMSSPLLNGGLSVGQHKSGLRLLREEPRLLEKIPGVVMEAEL